MRYSEDKEYSKISCSNRHDPVEKVHAHFVPGLCHPCCAFLMEKAIYRATGASLAIIKAITDFTTLPLGLCRWVADSIGIPRNEQSQILSSQEGEVMTVCGFPSQL